MKTMKLFSIAAVALLMAACSNSDDFDVQKPAEIAGVYHFEATIAAPDADATMRTVYTEDGTTINVKWEVGDKIALVHNGVVDEAEVKTVDNVTGKATIKATITGSPKDNDDVYLAYPADAVFSATPYKTFHFTPHPDIFDKVKNYQDGTLAYIQNNLDLRTGDGKLAVSGDKVTLKESVSIPSIICIWKLTLQDESSKPLSATQLTFKNETYTLAKATSAAKNEYYLCVVPGYIPAPAGTYSFEATVGGDTYTFSKTDLSLTAGKYYQSTVKMAKPTNLSTISSDYEAKDGEILTGTLANNVKISIADGATVTLKDANINGSGTWNSGNYAGITCAGDATINLEGTNSVKGFSLYNPGIYVPKNNTLTIQGSGSLDATGRNMAAGIGGGKSGSCGNITINGGTITATGGANAAGIGGGFMNGACGTITITSGVTVTATRGSSAPNSIGAGLNGTAISVTIEAGANVTANGLALSASAVGEIVGSDGKAYAASDKDNLPSGVTAVAMVAYKSGTNGLAIALADEASKMNWSTANGASGAAAHTPTVTGQTWKLPSKDEWDNMISAAGSYTALRDGFNGIGGTNMQSSEYWSSTERGSDNAWDYDFEVGEWDYDLKGYGGYVRACLAF